MCLRTRGPPIALRYHLQSFSMLTTQNKFFVKKSLSRQKGDTLMILASLLANESVIVGPKRTLVAWGPFWCIANGVCLTGQIYASLLVIAVLHELAYRLVIIVVTDFNKAVHHIFVWTWYQGMSFATSVSESLSSIMVYGIGPKLYCTFMRSKKHF